MKTATHKHLTLTLDNVRYAAKNCPTHGQDHPPGFGRSHTYVVVRNRKRFSPPLFVRYICSHAGDNDIKPPGDTNAWTFRVLRELGVKVERI